MINRLYLYYLIKSHGDTKDDLAKALGISRQGLYLKCTGKQACDFRLNEIKTIASRYNLTSDEILKTFFTNENGEPQYA